VTEKEYKKMTGIFRALFRKNGANPNDLEDLAHDALIIYLKDKTRTIDYIVIDILRASGAGRKRSENYEERKIFQQAVEFDLKKHDYGTEFSLFEGFSLPDGFVSKAWRGPIKRIVKGILTGEKHKSIAASLGVSESRVSQILSENRPMLMRRFRKCMNPKPRVSVRRVEDKKAYDREYHKKRRRLGIKSKSRKRSKEENRRRYLVRREKLLKFKKEKYRKDKKLIH
jgi:predicted transcriptional regulator